MVGGNTVETSEKEDKCVIENDFLIDTENFVYQEDL
jgi:hypothetical protein